MAALAVCLCEIKLLIFFGHFEINVGTWKNNHAWLTQSLIHSSVRSELTSWSRTNELASVYNFDFPALG